MFYDWILNLITSPNIEYLNSDTLISVAALILCYFLFSIFDNINYFFKRLIK